MERRWQFPVLIMANEAEASPSFSVWSVCVWGISLYQFVSQCCQSSYSWKKKYTDHPALLVLFIQLPWLNYLPGQETRALTQRRDQVLFKAAPIPYIADLQGHHTSWGWLAVLSDPSNLWGMRRKKTKRREMAPDEQYFFLRVKLVNVSWTYLSGNTQWRVNYWVVMAVLTISMLCRHWYDTRAKHFIISHLWCSGLWYNSGFYLGDIKVQRLFIFVRGGNCRMSLYHLYL